MSIDTAVSSQHSLIVEVPSVGPTESARPSMLRRRVLHVINGEHYSGAERVQDLLGLRLPEFGYEIAYACIKPDVFPSRRKALDLPKRSWATHLILHQACDCANPQASITAFIQHSRVIRWQLRRVRPVEYSETKSVVTGQTVVRGKPNIAGSRLDDVVNPGRRQAITQEKLAM